MKDIKEMTIEELESELISIRTRQGELKRKLRQHRFNKYPVEIRKIMKSIGWAPEDSEEVTRRIGGSFEIKK